MPRKATVKKAKEALREGKRSSTAAGEFVREEVEHLRRGKHGARSTRQAVAIGLSQARRAGIPLPPPGKGRAKPEQGRHASKAPSRKRSQATSGVLRRQRTGVASKRALSQQAKRAAARRKRRARGGR